MTVRSAICEIERLQKIIDKYHVSIAENAKNKWDENGRTDEEYYAFIIKEHGISYKDACAIVNILKEEIGRIEKMELRNE